MKRLGVYACMVVSLVGMLGGFFAPEKTHAQTTGTAKTLAQYEAQGKALFDAQLLALNNKRADPAATSSFPTTITVVDALIQSVTKASGIFSTSINGGGSDLAILYRNALIAAKNSISEDQRLNPQALRTPYATNVISAFTRQLEAAAFDPSKTDALIAGGYTPTQAQLLSVDLKNARAAAVTGATEAKKPETKKCSVLGTDALIGCIDQAVTWIIKNTILQIGGFFVWLTANMFNYAVKIGILQFAKWAPDQLYPIWLIVRQIISLFIVFIGLYLGLMYILGKDEKFQKYIPWVIMFALFVNFSYPLVRTAIDISNIVSLKIYASAVGPGALDENPTNTAGAQILDKLGLQGLLMSATATKDGDGGLLGSIDSIPGALLAVIYVFYAGYIFFMVTALIVMRTAALVFLIVASPLLLVDSVLPMLGDKAKDLRKIFFEQLAVGPIFMIMMALTLKFLDVFKSTGQLGSGSISGTMGAGGMSTVVVFFNILMMLIMLWIMLKVTKDSAGSLGKYATDAFGKVGGFATGAAVSGALAGSGFLARKGIGGLAAKARDSKWVTNNQDSFIGRRAYNLSNSVASSTFDLRNTAVAQKYAGKLGISSGMGAGTKMGYDEESKATLEKRTKEALARSARIKTHHERDVYKDKLDEKGNVVYEDVKDANGNVVKRVKAQELVHRKGDINAEGWEAKNKLMASGGGTTFFRSKEQTQKVREAMAKDEEEKAAKRIAENKANSAADIATYRGINGSEELPDGTVLTAKQSKARFLAGLEKELDDLKKTDPTMQGNQAQSLLQSIQSIKKTEAAENAAFDKQVKYVLSNYMNKTGADKENYLSNQTQEVHEAVKALAAEQIAAKDAVKNGPLDLDLSDPVDKKASALAAASALSGQVQAVLADKPQNGAVPIYSNAVDVPLGSTNDSAIAAASALSGQVQAVLADKPQNGAAELPGAFNVAQIGNMDFAAMRAAKLKRNAQIANREMEGNASTFTTQVPGTPTPPSGPQPSAANQPNINNAAAWAGKGDTNVPTYMRKNVAEAPEEQAA